MEDAAEHVEKMLLAVGKEVDKGAESFLRALRVQGEARLSYGEILRRSTVKRGVMEIGPDAFDYGLYYYGMEHCGNIPLIEENKYREERRIAALVIAVDTSASAQHRDVEQFFAETLGIFREEQAFFRDAEIYLTQCDETMHEDRRCHSLDELRAVQGSLQLSGGGGTNFRPLFRYLEELTAQGALLGFRGVFCSIDGKGQFSEQAIPHQTVFIFPGREEGMEQHVPAWVLKAYLEEKKA